ncbi:MAG: 50S ribosomal protein L29 [Thermoplasmata archaeon]|nr:50S ribosomal protein L29 [Thermoplasmata archaeon]
MPALRAKEIRAMSAEERRKKLEELEDDLIHERGVAAMGGAPANPGKLRAIRIQIARMLTVMNEEKKKAKGGE